MSAQTSEGIARARAKVIISLLHLEGVSPMVKGLRNTAGWSGTRACRRGASARQVHLACAEWVRYKYAAALSPKHQFTNSENRQNINQHEIPGKLSNISILQHTF